MILMIDNYDSFTYNLVQYLGEMGCEVTVKRNDRLTIEDIEELHPDVLMISPGPCTPDEAGISMEAIRMFAGKIPIFGVCLGHQAIAQVFGAQIVRAERLMHGKTSEVHHDEKTIFRGLPSPLIATRYHSLIVNRQTLPSEFTISAWTEEEEVMAIRNEKLAIESVQFHPESILTKQGKMILGNFLQIYSPSLMRKP
ncbi:MAG TPA: aminodeoxychorismate/anthranilate synthase component II [Bacillales bacterium]|nr:aminodeoxychorismate/anthranilate synthase component II [Bacillales bacterium]